MSLSKNYQLCAVSTFLLCNNSSQLSMALGFQPQISGAEEAVHTLLVRVTMVTRTASSSSHGGSWRSSGLNTADTVMCLPAGILFVCFFFSIFNILDFL